MRRSTKVNQKTNANIKTSVSNKVRWTTILIFATLSFIASGCFFPAVDVELTGGYVIVAPDLVEQAALGTREPGSQSTFVVVDAMVFEYGWNDSFIVAKQHPLGDSSITNWFIVEVETDVVHGPLTESDFEQLFEELEIPDDVEFSNSLPVPE